MSLEPQEQFKKFVQESKDVLILLPKNPNGDVIGSAWALNFYFDKKNISSTIAVESEIPKKYSFLPSPKNIIHEVSGARDFVLSFDTSRNKIMGLRHEEIDGKFNIYLTPEKGSIDPRDFSFILAKFKYDLIIVLGVSDLEKLGSIYEMNSDLFFEVPVINIDHHSNNENFGQINLVDITASSCSEILKNAITQNNAEALDKAVADSLLTGIISATDSFQKRNTTPRALLAAADLMDKGADQQEIVRWLYKTQPLHILKLLGRAMSKVNWNAKTKLIWSDLSVEDFVQSRSNQADIPQILEKLRDSYSEGKIFMIIYNDTPSTCVAVIKANTEILRKINSAIEGSISNDILEIKLNSSDTKEAGDVISRRLSNLEL